MNFILDIGNVLIHFKPMDFLNDLFPGDNQPLRDALYETIFASGEWRELDRGAVTHDEAREIFRTRRPELASAAALVMDNLEDMLTPMPESVALLAAIKSSGHRLYYLSNYHKRLSAYITGKYDFFSLFDGGVFSCDVHVNKPSAGIYRRLLEKYGLDPGECVFFDDTPENVEAGKREGIKGIVFNGPEDIKGLCVKKPAAVGCRF